MNVNPKNVVIITNIIKDQTINTIFEFRLMENNTPLTIVETVEQIFIATMYL